ncbi:hypothetical protein B0H11DRAFT_211520 [Mycena galericulata]|nr:hypothetical protein B0H11DRAFT_211520 [Mycena galericulata]
MDIVKGSMVGIYTGLILRRKDAASLPNFRLSYCFDLDAMENLKAEHNNSYTVDAFSCGNWTRFINHSCEPNLRVMPVVSDTVPEDNLPYLAFVAAEDISAYSEFTFDYNPKHQLEWERKKFSEKGSVKKKRGKTEARCRCREMSWMVAGARGIK